MDSSTAPTSVKLKSSAFACTGKNIKPAVTVKAGKKAVPAKGHKVSYRDNKELGYAAVTVAGKGSYSGSASTQFKIAPKGAAIEEVAKGRASAAVKWKKRSARMSGKRVAGYQMRYSTKPSMKSDKTAKVKGCAKTAKKVRGLKANEKHCFQVRAYMKGGEEAPCSKWSKKKLAR